MRRWFIRTQWSGTVEKILENCCKMYKRCYSAGKLVNWSDGADEEKTAGYCQILHWVSAWSSFLLQWPYRSKSMSNENPGRKHIEWHREFKENLDLSTVLKYQKLIQSWLLSLDPSNTSGCIPRDALTWNMCFHCQDKSYILTFMSQH